MKKNLSEKKLLLCSLQDSVAESFGSPTTFINESVAIRSFSDLMSDSHYSKNKSDYSLVLVGYYNPEDGIISPCPHKILFRGVDVG